MTKVRTIYGKNKTAVQLATQLEEVLEDINILITELDLKTFMKIPCTKFRVGYPTALFDLNVALDSDKKVNEYRAMYGDDIASIQLTYVDSCNCAVVWRNWKKNDLKVAITSAGIADRNIVDEAGLTVMMHSYTPKFFNDIGVNDLKKTTDSVDDLNECSAIISVQGFEGALPVVLAGLVSLPIISVPTSTGYGVSAKGYTALNTSLSSCTSGISTVNINNGFGAGEVAVRILDMVNSYAGKRY